MGKSSYHTAVRSWVEPGQTLETHSGEPVGSNTTCTLPPKAWCLPEYHRWCPRSARAVTRLLGIGVRSRHAKGSQRRARCAVRRPGRGRGRRSRRVLRAGSARRWRYSRRPRRPACAGPGGDAASAARGRPGRAPCPPAPGGIRAVDGAGRFSRSPPSTPSRTHPGWHDETQRAPGEDGDWLWRDDLRPESPRSLHRPTL